MKLGLATPQKRMFQLDKCAQRRPPEQPVKIPRVADIRLGVAVHPVPPPQALVQRLGDPKLILGFDIEAPSARSTREG
jgi:hypothetical protein